jgi:elongation factor G
VKAYDTQSIRNFALLGHGTSGKTTITEAILHTTGATNRMGLVEDGNTHSDFLDDEISRQISIGTTLIQAEWNDSKLNVVDTPGYADFVGEVICGIRVADTAGIVVDAISGPEVGTETAWSLCEERDKPRFFIINRTGKEHADALKVLDAITERFGIRALPIQIPVNPGESFNKIVDIISMKEYTYDLNGSGIGKVTDISDDLKDEAEELHEKLIEAAAESDDSLMEKFFESGLTPEEVRKGVKAAIVNRSLYPVFFTDALSNVGVDLLMNHLVDSGPSPADMPPIKAENGDEIIELAPTADAPLGILVFKTIMEQHVGELSLFRVFSGSYSVGDELYNSTHVGSEKSTVIYNLVGKERTEIKTVVTGDMGTFVKMKHTHTSDTLCTKHMQFTFPPLAFPEPVIDVAVYPTTKGEEDKVSQGLTKLRDEDPSLHVRNNAELHQIILEGLGGLHIDVAVDRLKKKFGIEVELKAPKIPYRETITGNADEKYRYKKQTGGRGQYGEVYLRMEPLPRGGGFEFDDAIKGGVIPGRFIPAVEKGVVERMVEGPLSKSKVVDIKVTLYYGSYHTVDSSEMAFKTAASLCFKECFLKSKPILLEPIYNIEVKVPDAYTGDVMGDLSSRRGKIMGMEPSGIFQIIKAKVPLVDLYLYATQLRSITQGRGAYTRDFSHYELVPPDVTQKVIESTKEQDE